LKAIIVYCYICFSDNVSYYPASTTEFIVFTNIVTKPYNVYVINSIPLFLLLAHIQIFFSETAWLNELKVGQKHLWKVLYKDSFFCSVPLANMTTVVNSCFWLVNF
jgi:hypothetical protein